MNVSKKKGNKKCLCKICIYGKLFLKTIVCIYTIKYTENKEKNCASKSD